MARVLVVDDEGEICTFIREALKLRGHEVRSASTGADGWKELDSGPFDVILVDYRLPDEDGLDMACRIAADHAGTRVFVMSGVNLNGADIGLPHLQKPFGVPQLLGAVEG